LASTDAPSASRRLAIATPMPPRRLAPVTTATLPAS
jgi:hypothetical protein